MERAAKSRRRFLAVLTLALLLIAAGLVMLYRVFDRYEEVILQNEDGQLYGLARSVERSVDSCLGRYADNLSYLTGRSYFREAEAQWLAGDGGELLRRMRDNLVAQDALNAAVLALRDGQVALSTSGRTDYFFPPRAGRDGPVSIRPCVDGDGTIYLSFVQETGNGVAYAALIDLPGFYRRVAGDAGTGGDDRIMLLDAGGQTLLHRTPDGVRVDLVETLDGASCDFSGLAFLLDRQRAGAEGAMFYEAGACRTGEAYTARMAVIPATDAGNGFFAVGVSINYDEVIRPLQTAAIRLLAYGGMAVLGAALLAGLTLWSARKNERALRELELLRRKNETIEALNRQTQELAHHQRLETIGTLTSSIAHEFNNLLTPIMGYSILVLERLPQDDTELYDSVLEIYNASRKAKEIISRLSDLSRKNPAAAFQDVAPDELVRRVLEVAAPARPARVEVAADLHGQGLLVRGNETQLSQMLLNLVLNGFQAIGPEGGALTVSTAADGAWVRLRVTDTGCGIEAGALPHIFEPFYTTKEHGKGTGLGLAIVQQVVEAHHGELAVESTPGRGTAFTVHLPAASGD